MIMVLCFLMENKDHSELKNDNISLTKSRLINHS